MKSDFFIGLKDRKDVRFTMYDVRFNVKISHFGTKKIKSYVVHILHNKKATLKQNGFNQ
jgi:hypothetical protein